jgi:DNA polymerase elongation subunit (family B)
MFISSFYDRYSDKVIVWEKTNSGKRIRVEHLSPYYFYVPSKTGTFTAITDEKLEKLEFNSKREFDDACYKYEKRFESDLTTQEKVMMTYFGKPIPKLIIGFLDIEVDYDPSIGFSRPSNPYAPINAITLYRTDLEAYFTIAIPPPEWGNKPLPDEMIADNYFIVRSERELLEQFLMLIEEVDVLTGWNSEFFDIPYIAKRIELLFGQAALKKLGFEGAPAPRWGEKDRFKGSSEKELVIDLQSRVHLDYMALFKKFNLGGRQSYALNSIGEEEVDEKKIEYDGSLHELYHNDFAKFILYNRHDVRIIIKIDKKFKYIELANEMVHEATVNFSAIFGSVQLIDTAIINFCHSHLNRIVFDKVHKPKQSVEGALVMSPVVGLHRMIGSCDINSLYPSTYRSLNLSPEKIVGQLAEYEEGWRAIYNGINNPDNDLNMLKTVTIIPEDSQEERVSLSVREMIDLLKQNKYAVSGYGTILDQGNGEGLIPAVLTYWFNGRKEMQALKKKYAKEADLIFDKGIKLDSLLDK